MPFEQPPVEKVDSNYFARRAEQARAMAELATAARARDLHLLLAAEYDAKAAEALGREQE